MRNQQMLVNCSTMNLKLQKSVLYTNQVNDSKGQFNREIPSVSCSLAKFQHLRVELTSSFSKRQGTDGVGHIQEYGEKSLTISKPPP